MFSGYLWEGFGDDLLTFWRITSSDYQGTHQEGFVSPKKVSDSSAHDDDEEKIRKRKKMMKKIWEKERRWWEKWEEKKMMRKACEEKWKAAGAELLIVWGANKKLMKCFSPGIMVMMKVEQSWWKYIFIYLKFIFLHMLIVCIEN